MAVSTGNDGWSVSGMSATGKDLVAMLRDGLLLLMAVLLISLPETFNSILVRAGFEEGSFAGIKWKKKLTESDDALLKAQATIADLTAQNQKLSEALSGTKGQVASADTKAYIGRLEQLNARVASMSEHTQQAVRKSLAANTPFVEKIHGALGTAVTWGVVYGGDATLEAAQYEVETIAPKLGLTNARVYHRQGSYRSVATTTDRSKADEMLKATRERRADAYLVKMGDFCPDPAEQKGYFECTSS
jgi:hypothetical protein